MRGRGMGESDEEWGERNGEKKGVGGKEGREGEKEGRERGG